MPRRAVPDETQRLVLLRSRRRCCLCFWLDGIDEVRKGQIAHLDGDNSNAEEDNLVFLCLEHHDEYDSRTSTSKGLREDEVRRWRDELYREMEYRFRATRTRSLELTIEDFLFYPPKESRDPLGDGQFALRFRLKNTGESAVRTPTLAVALPDKIEAKRDEYMDLAWGQRMKVPDLYGFAETREDFFEPAGRVAVIEPIGGINPILMRGHSITFDGLLFHLRDFPLGSRIELTYRIDGEDMTPIIGTVTKVLPSLQDDQRPGEK